MHIPAYLKTGDKIAILCPASFIKEDLSKAYKILIDWGLVPVIYDSVSAQENQFAGDDSLRASDLQKALDDPSIKAIIAGRGGYGCVRIIDRLNFDAFQKNPKWIVGFSDITVLLSHVQHNYNIASIHGQMVKSFLSATPASLDILYHALFGNTIDISYTINSLEPNRIGNATGILTGGNLAILQSILSSSSAVNFDNKILFIEDIGESFYNIDRMLWSLKRANKLHKLRGLIVGSFTELKDSDPSFGKSYQEIIMEKIQEHDFPVAFGFPSGHIDDNRALVFGREVNLTVNNQQVELSYS